MLRRATAIVLAAAISLTASAVSPEIPKKALDQEARTRAALTPVEQARVNTHVARLTTKMSLQDVKAMTQGDSMGCMFVVMMEYLKLLQKEAREDRKLARANADLSLAAKAGKLDQEKSKIEAQKREAEERFEHAMAAANLEMTMGILSGLATVGGAGIGASGATGKGSVSAPTGAVRVVTPIPVRGVSVATKTPTRTPAPGK